MRETQLKGKQKKQDQAYFPSNWVPGSPAGKVCKQRLCQFQNYRFFSNIRVLQKKKKAYIMQGTLEPLLLFERGHLWPCLFPFSFGFSAGICVHCDCQHLALWVKQVLFENLPETAGGSWCKRKQLEGVAALSQFSEGQRDRGSRPWQKEEVACTSPTPHLSAPSLSPPEGSPP